MHPMGEIKANSRYTAQPSLDGWHVIDRVNGFKQNESPLAQDEALELTNRLNGK